MEQTLWDLAADRRGVTALEYGILAGTMSLVLMLMFFFLAGDLLGVFVRIEAAI